MKRVALTSVTAALLASGCSQAGGQESSNMIPDREKALIQTTYERAKDFWKERLVAQVVLVEGAQIFPCDMSPRDQRSMITSADGPYYCEGSRAIAVTGVWGSWALRFAQGDVEKAEDGTVFMLAHEVGHDIEERNKPLRVRELEADCLAGRFMGQSGHYGPSDIKNVISFIGNMPTDADHGTAFQRFDAFKAGTEGQDCAAVAARL